MPVINIVNLSTHDFSVQDTSGQSGFNVKVPASSTKSDVKITDDTLQRLAAQLDAAVTAGTITYTVQDDPSTPVDNEMPALRVALVTPVTVLDKDDMVVCKLTTPAAVTVVLPSALPIGKVVNVIDGTGDAATRNITIDPEGGATINGAATLVLSTNYAGARLVKTSATTWLRAPG